MPNEGPVDFLLGYTELKEKLILISKPSREFVHDEVLVSSLFLRNLKKGLDSNLILQEIRTVLRSQGVTDEDIFTFT